MPRRVSLPGAEELFRGMPAKPTAADSIEPGSAPPGIDERDVPDQLSPEADHAGPEADHAGPGADHAGPGADHAGPGADHAGPEAERTSPEAERTSPEAERTSPELVEGRSSTSSDRGTAGSDRGTAGSEAAAESDGNGRSRNRRRGSGRVRHDEKITVYVSRDELLSLERARLSLRAEYGMAVDRGRIVREALAMVLDDLAENGEQSDLARRLTQP